MPVNIELIIDIDAVHGYNSICVSIYGREIIDGDTDCSFPGDDRSVARIN